MTHTRRVKDIMLALSEYAVVPQDATLRDALDALDEAQKHVPPGRHPHRAVLVRNRQNQIVGKVDHLAFLRALLPEFEVFGREHDLARAGVSDDMRSVSIGVFEFLGEELVDVSRRVSHVKVANARTPATACIDEDATLFEAIQEFLKHQALSLLVHRGGRTVGVLRLADLFDDFVRQARSGDDSRDEG